MVRAILVGFGLLAIANPAVAGQTAIGAQILEDFEGRALGPTSINFCDVAFPDADCLGTLSGGSVAMATLAFPAASPSHVYTGTFITLDILENADFSWPAAAAYVSGTAPIRFRAWAYDTDLGDDKLVADFSTSGDDRNALVTFGSDIDPQFLTLVEFSSDAIFAIDDFRIGLPDVSPGIPEPASWALLIAGFGLVGAAMRRRVNRLKSATPPG
jgi:hypothetical protein